MPVRIAVPDEEPFVDHARGEHVGDNRPHDGAQPETHSSGGMFSGLLRRTDARIGV